MSCNPWTAIFTFFPKKNLTFFRWKKHFSIIKQLYFFFSKRYLRLQMDPFWPNFSSFSEIFQKPRVASHRGQNSRGCKPSWPKICKLSNFRKSLFRTRLMKTLKVMMIFGYYSPFPRQFDHFKCLLEPCKCAHRRPKTGQNSYFWGILGSIFGEKKVHFGCYSDFFWTFNYTLCNGFYIV